MRKKKILFIGTQMARAGAQHVLLEIATWFHARGYEVVVAFMYDREGLAAQWQAEYPFPVIDLRGFSSRGGYLRLPFGIFRLWKLLSNVRFDLVHTLTPHANLIGLPVAWVAGVASRVASHHGPIGTTSYLFDRVHGILVNSPIVDCEVVVSSSVADYAVNRERTDPKKLVTIFNGIEPFGPASREELDRLRLELGLKETDIVLLAVGRLESQKRHIRILEAFANICHEFPQARLLIAGHGSLYGELEAFIAKNHLGNNAHLLSSRNDIDKLLHVSDVFIMPSSLEGLPLALLEAMGAGLPVVVSDIGPMLEIVRDREDGIVVPLDHIEALTDAIRQLLEDKMLRQKMGDSAKKRVTEAFSTEAMNRAYETLFEGHIES